MMVPRLRAFAFVVGFCATGAASVLADVQPPTTPSIPSPWIVADLSPDGVFTELSAPADAFATLSAQRELVLTGFALDPVQSLDLHLKQFDVLTADARLVRGTADGDVPVARPQLALFRGLVGEDPDSHVFLAITPTRVNGWVWHQEQRYLLSSGPHGEGLAPVVFNLTTLPDGALRWAEFVCGAGDLVQPATPQDLSPSGSRAVECQRAEIAVDSDFEFTNNLFGGDSEESLAYTLTLIGAVSEIYTRDVQTPLDVSYSRVWTENVDPYTGADQLGEFRNHWTASQGGVQRDVAQYLSGMGGGGVAWVGVICDYNYGYGMSNVGGSFPYPLQDHHWNNWDPFVVAHEVGHNFGAWHTHDLGIDGCGFGDCSMAWQGTIMSYCHGCAGGMTNISLKFHERSINENMLPHIASRNCLAADGPPITVQPAADQTLCGGETAILFTSSNILFPVYQWYKGNTALTDSADLIGSASPVLYFPSLKTSQAGDYHCVVSDAITGCLTETQEATVNVRQATTITSNPASQSVSVGGFAVFAVSTLEPSFQSTYEWRRNGVALIDDGRIGGATTSTLIITGATPADAGEYDVLVTNVFSGCASESQAATLSVAGICPGDVNGDGVVDLGDLGILLANFGMPGTPATGDLNNDGVVDLTDLGVVLAEFGTDC